MSADEKNSEKLGVWMGETLLREIERLARADHRSPSEYVRVILSRYVYGHCARQQDEKHEGE